MRYPPQTVGADETKTENKSKSYYCDRIVWINFFR